MADFVATHQAKQDPPPRVRITIYDPAAGHIAVAPADAVEKLTDGRDGTLLQGQNNGHGKSPVAVYKGYAIVEYEGHVYATMPAADVSAWFEPIANSKIPALPARTPLAERIDDALKETP